MKKCISILIVFLLLFSIKVKGYYNGEGGSFPMPSGSGSTCGTTAPCQYENFDYVFLQLRLYYIANGEFEQIGGTFYATNAKGIQKLTNLGIDSEHMIYISAMDKIDTNAGNRYQQASKMLREHFGDNNENNINKLINENLKDFFKKAVGDDYLTVLTNNTSPADPDNKNPAKVGYRIIIEPAILYIKAPWANFGGSIISVKAAAIKRNGAYSNYSWGITSLPLVGSDSAQAQFLYTTFDDVGISRAGLNDEDARNNCTKVNLATLANVKTGCGYNIIDVGKFIERKCYEKSIKGSIECKNTDKNNQGYFYELYEQKDCDKIDAEDISNNKYGKRVKRIANCDLYCKEEAYASFPGNISSTHPFDVNTDHAAYFTWPSIIGKGSMTMTMKSKITCRIVERTNKNCTSDNIKSMKQHALSYMVNQINFEASLVAGTNNKIDEKLETYNVRYGLGENKKIQQEKATIYGSTEIEKMLLDKKIEIGKNYISKEFSLIKEANLKIPSYKNRYYNIIDGRVSDNKTDFSMYYDREEGVISHKITDKANQYYELKIKNVKLGSGVFDSKIAEYGYVCKYKFERTNNPPTNNPPCDDCCVCPPGTVLAGTDLYHKITADKTCVELQQTECNVCQCPPDSDFPDREVHVGADATKENCNEKVFLEQCYKKPHKCEYKIKNKTIEIDTKNCEEEQKEKNKLTDKEAYEYCKEILCPGCIDKKGELVDISECIAEGNSYKICEFLFCPKDLCPGGICPELCLDDCKWTFSKIKGVSVTYKKTCGSEDCGSIVLSCPGGKTNMKDPTDCMQQALKHRIGNSSLQEALNNEKVTVSEVRKAFDACKEEVCPSATTKAKIVFRTIDLKNPFPGKNNTSVFDKFGYKGRMPGENWESKTAISTKILNARDAEGYALYNKDPLYIINLTPSAMKKIREYNKTHSYNDFNLDCKNDDKSSACISEFLHENTVNNLNVSDLIVASYDGRNSVVACRNMDKNEAGFYKCYNESN